MKVRVTYVQAFFNLQGESRIVHTTAIVRLYPEGQGFREGCENIAKNGFYLGDDTYIAPGAILKIERVPEK